MTTKPLSKQAKVLMDAADTLELSVCTKYGASSGVGLQASMAAAYMFYIYCELERVEGEESVDVAPF